jgi:transcriptional regulator GlxA family with amidase domain
VQRLRLDEARRRLSAASCSVASVGDSIGFHDPDSFRRAFLLRFGLAPHQYRTRFLAEAQN